VILKLEDLVKVLKEIIGGNWGCQTLKSQLLMFNGHGKQKSKQHKGVPKNDTPFKISWLP
jgi:hypothetical protein